MSERTPHLAAAMRAFDSPTLANAIETFDVRDLTEGYASSEVRFLTPRSGPMVGYAVTVTFEGTTPSAQRTGPAGWVRAAGPDQGGTEAGGRGFPVRWT